MKFNLLIFLFLIFNTTFSQKEGNQIYSNYIDSSIYYSSIEPNIADSFLNLIPKPIDENLDKYLIADFYFSLALIDINLKRDAASFKNYINAVKYAEQNKDYALAADASYWLSSRFYWAKKDSLANIYLEKSKKYYTEINDSLGLIRVLQILPYQERVKKNYSKSNELIFEHLDVYESISEEVYYIMFANYLLTINFLGLGEIENANKYFKDFKTRKEDTTVVKSTFQYFENSILINYVDFYLEEENTDSALTILNSLNKNRNSLDYALTKNMYENYIKVYKLLGEVDTSLAYLDSLSAFQKKMLDNTVETNIEINEEFLGKDNKIYSITKKNLNYLYLILALIVLLILATSIFLFRKKHLQTKVDAYENKLSKFEFLSKNQDKLQVKITALEDYIGLLKDEISEIASSNNIKNQQEKLKQLYKNLNIKINSSPSKKGNHIHLVNELNAQFFIDIRAKHPELNDSEIVVCYYLFIGLKNNEIATFLNVTLRAIESKRFRISKKINIDSKKTNLVEYLVSNFTN